MIFKYEPDQFGGRKFLFHFAGIVVSVFVARYGCRIVCVIGGLVWTLGLFSSAWTYTMGLLYFTYGIVAGNKCDALIKLFFFADLSRSRFTIEMQFSQNMISRRREIVHECYD